MANNWKGLQPEVKESYGKLAAFQQRQYEKEVQPKVPPKWKNHVKVLATTPMSVQDPPLPVPSLVEDEDVDQVVNDVLALLGAEDVVLDPPLTTTEPPFWPLHHMTPIADFIRSHRYPQHALTPRTTCLPCTTTAGRSSHEAVVLAAILEEDGRDFFLKSLLLEDDLDSSHTC